MPPRASPSNKAIYQVSTPCTSDLFLGLSRAASRVGRGPKPTRCIPDRQPTSRSSKVGYLRSALSSRNFIHLLRNALPLETVSESPIMHRCRFGLVIATAFQLSAFLFFWTACMKLDDRMKNAKPNPFPLTAGRNSSTPKLPKIFQDGQIAK